ncbi:TonB-dependent receptor domain-containing protein [Sphingomonas sp. 37zxx]|uniref:TonB-dependent receptor domain-containing protein n=1 Tax=Sphingomonas sp. 37zxx TaxID=1550073 RepID=UPI00053C062A|nr:TonB-dependent receptor [Sphingomonas sp. 37zxx]
MAAAPALAQSTDQDALLPASAATEIADTDDDGAALPGSAAQQSDRDQIVVTGTRIVRPNNRSAAPIITTTARDIAVQGATTIEEVLNRLPQVQPNAEQNYADSDGRQRIKLRSLGFERTLTLIDGMRIGLQNGGDVGLIPNVLVERIDVLSGGASSVYGSDAVSGVVNFILKKNFEGLTVTGNYSLYNHNNRANEVTDAAGRAGFPAASGWTNDGGRMDVSATGGINLLDGAVNITGFVNYRQSGIVPLSARSTSACEVTQPTKDGPLACSLASFVPAGTIIPLSGAQSGQLLVNNPNGNGTFVPLNSAPGTQANPFDDFSFQREFKRINAGGFLTAQLSSDIEFYSSALWYRDRSRNPQINRTLNYQAYGTQPYQVNCNNPFLSSTQAGVLCGAAAGTSALVPLDVRYRFGSLESRYDEYENRGVRVTAGLRGRGFDDAWTYDLSGVYAENTATADLFALPNFANINRALNVVNVNGRPTCQSVVNGTDPACVPFNAFAPFNNDPALNAYISGTDTRTGTSSPRLFQVVGTISGDLGRYGITSPYAEDGVAVAVGTEFRSERFKSAANAAFRASQGGNDARFTQSVKEVNAEVQVPLVQNQSWTDLLQFNAGYRLSEYNRLEDTFDTWKIEGLWAPIADITFRGSYNKAQRAPTVIEADQASNINYTSIGSRNDPCAPQPNPANPSQPLPPAATIEQCRNTGLPDNLYGSAALNCPDNSCTIRNGGFGLMPETAYTKTFGVVLRPRFLPGLTVSVDRFLIDLEDSINFFAANDFLNGCLSTGIDYYCRGIVRNPGTFTLASPAGTTPTTGYIAQGTSNGYESKSHGWDFQGQYALPLGNVGSLDMAFNGTLTTMVGSQDAPNVPPRNCVGYFGPGCGESMVDWSHVLSTTWSSPKRDVSMTVNWRHHGSQTITFNADPVATGIPVNTADRRTTYAEIPAYNYIDLSLAFDIAKRFNLRFSVNNLFDKDPPLLPNARNVLGLLRTNSLMRYDMLGRQLVAGATMKF